MKNRLTLLALPLVAALGACGGDGDEIRVTNDSNVVLNESYENQAFVNDGEVPTTEDMANESGVANDTLITNATADPATGNGTDPTL